MTLSPSPSVADYRDTSPGTGEEIRLFPSPVPGEVSASYADGGGMTHHGS
jgi:hypothetical protein